MKIRIKSVLELKRSDIGITDLGMCPVTGKFLPGNNAAKRSVGERKDKIDNLYNGVVDMLCESVDEVKQRNRLEDALLRTLNEKPEKSIDVLNKILPKEVENTTVAIAPIIIPGAQMGVQDASTIAGTVLPSDE